MVFDVYQLSCVLFGGKERERYGPRDDEDLETLIVSFDSDER